VSIVGLSLGKRWAGLAVSSSAPLGGEAKVKTLANGAASSDFMSELTRDGGQDLAVTTVDTYKTTTFMILGRSGLSEGRRFTSMCKKFASSADRGRE
jgi:hypothetical protein